MRTAAVPLTAALLLACPSADESGVDTTSGTPSTAAAAATKDTVIFETSRGAIALELDAAQAPQSVDNFLKHVRSRFYDGLVFHRIESFVIQAGSVTEAGAQRKSSVFPIPNEAENGLKNLRGTVGMARTSDPHSATSEFFINLKDNPTLDFTAPTVQGWGYAVFGRVVEGMSVVDAIAATPTTRRGTFRTYPTEPTVIRRAFVKGSAPAASP